MLTIDKKAGIAVLIPEHWVSGQGILVVIKRDIL